MSRPRSARAGSRRTAHGGIRRTAAEPDDYNRGEPLAMRMWGSLQLRATVSAARGNRTSEAEKRIGYARDAASRMNDYQGPSALGDHRPQFDALSVAIGRAHGPIVCLVDDWDRLTRDALQSSVMRHRIGQAGGHTVTAEGESDAPAEKARGRLCTPH
ncbi:hypothetical protein [Streptomyces sp. NBC_00191]|uniref:hypothetical protein n=1 Tax=Streptomyces sp. NBC_00191 TaxID=2975674 RepID=UPI003865DE51